MNNLKIKFGLFSLLAVLAVSIFLTSCQQDTVLPQIEETTDVQQIEFEPSVQEYVKKQGEVTFNLPSNMEGADENALQSYLADMSVEQIVEREVDYRIENFLGSLGRLDEVHEDLGQIDLLTINDLKKYTSEQELVEFNSFEVDSAIDSRWCYTPARVCVGFFTVKTRLCCTWGGCSTKVTWYWGC